MKKRRQKRKMIEEEKPVKVQVKGFTLKSREDVKHFMETLKKCQVKL